MAMVVREDGPPDDDTWEPRPIKKNAKGRKKGSDAALIRKFELGEKKRLSIKFDLHELRTAKPIGPNRRHFTGLIGNEIERSVPFCYESWDLVPDKHKGTIWPAINVTYFDMKEHLSGPNAKQVEKGMELQFKGQYRNRKNKFKDEMFVSRGGYENPVKMRNFPPPGKSLSEWHELCDHFTSEKHLAHSAKNKANRAKLPQCSTQGSKSYAASRHEEWETNGVFPDLIELYKKTHQKEGKWAKDVFEARYNSKSAAFHTTTHYYMINASSKVYQDIDVDQYISAELPDPSTNADGYVVISKLMIHGPCGFANTNSACMKDGSTCNRNFPKAYYDKTYIDKDGFVHYRQRDTGIETQRQNVWLDNRYVVPYNRTLCMRYYAHINMEYYGWTMLIKYLFKYISKGTDRVIANVRRPVTDVPSTSNVPAIQIDEIKNYVEERDNGFVAGQAALKAESSKVAKHEKACLENQHVFIPFAFDTFGFLAPEAEEFLNRVQRVVQNPMNLWQKFWKDLFDDIPRRLSKSLRIPQIERNEKKMKASVLFDIGVMLNSYSESLKDFGLPTPPEDMLPVLQNRLLMEETNYNPELLLKKKNLLIPRLNAYQKLIFEKITSAIQADVHKLIFVYGHGGTRKTFLWKVITSALRSEEIFFLTVASSGIASLLLPLGKTAHSRFQIPLNLKDECTCNIKKNSYLADLLRQTNLIIWDEAPMNDHRCFEVLDHCLRDILDITDTLFGGRSIMLEGDFRQTLPVKKKASKPENVDASITSSYLW
ncbi:DNA helicase [Tanacetum coccineum]|uniref:ATP-dependent DNA helicase n=1 Tax=Tanacetum coccineum TaxID=301880 RepID=A0ABQ5BZ47_9ASTR